LDVALMLHYRSDPYMLVMLTGLVCFDWGEIFSIFPAALTDTFGPGLHGKLRFSLHGAGSRQPDRGGDF
jgi:hypothetical protein